MGMFDYIRCEVPLPDGFTGEMQTKDLGCMLKTHIITAGGRLMVDEAGTFEHPERMADANWHGFINFYGSEGDSNNRGPNSTYRWHEYKAKFTDGQLVGIETVHNDR